jgi:hypothetical protein
MFEGYTYEDETKISEMNTTSSELYQIFYEMLNKQWIIHDQPMFFMRNGLHLSGEWFQLIKTS